MFSNPFYVLGMLGAMVLSIQYAHASENSHLQQTIMVEELMPAEQPGRFRRGMHHIKSGIDHALYKVSGGRLGHSKDEYAKKSSSSSEERKNTPSYVNQYEPSVRVVESTISVPVQTPPHAPLSELMDKSDSSFYEDNVQLHETHVVVDPRHQPMPVAHPSNLDDSSGEEIASGAVEIVGAVHETLDSASVGEAYRPIAHPTEVDASEYYQQPRDYNGPVGVVDGSDYVDEVDQSDVYASNELEEVVVGAAVDLVAGSQEASIPPDASEYYEQPRDYSGPLEVIDGSNYVEEVVLDQSEVYPSNELGEAVVGAAVDLVAGSQDASILPDASEYNEQPRDYSGPLEVIDGSDYVEEMVLDQSEVYPSNELGEAVVGAAVDVMVGSHDASEYDEAGNIIVHVQNDRGHYANGGAHTNGGAYANGGAYYANGGAHYANVPYTQPHATYAPEVEEEFDEENHSFIVDNTNVDLSEIERRNMEEEEEEEAEYLREEQMHATYGGATYARGPQTIGVH